MFASSIAVSRRVHRGRRGELMINPLRTSRPLREFFKQGTLYFTPSKQ